MEKGKMLEAAEKLAWKVQRLCKGKELVLVFTALEPPMEAVLEQIPNDELRNHVTIRMIHMILSLPIFGELEKASSTSNLSAVAAIADSAQRNAAALGSIKSIVGVSIPLFARATKSEDAKTLRQRYLAVEDELRRLLGRHYEHCSSAATIISCMAQMSSMTDGNGRLWAAAIYIQVLLAMEEFNDIECLN